MSKKLYITTKENFTLFKKGIDFWVKFLKIEVDIHIKFGEIIFVKDNGQCLISNEEIRAFAFREVCEVLYTKEKYKSDFLKTIVKDMGGFQPSVQIGDIRCLGYWKKAFSLRRYIT